MDCGNSRAGFDWDDDGAIEVAQRLKDSADKIDEKGSKPSTINKVSRKRKLAPYHKQCFLWMHVQIRTYIDLDQESEHDPLARQEQQLRVADSLQGRRAVKRIAFEGHANEQREPFQVTGKLLTCCAWALLRNRWRARRCFVVESATLADRATYAQYT